MSDAVNIWQQPDADETIMIAGWRQWADAGSTSSMLPKYLIQQTNATKIGEIDADGFYMFQIPGTHDLVRPIVQFHEGYPEKLEARKNELYHAKMGERDVIIFLGDEPHMNAELYAEALLDAAEQLKVTRIIGVAGVFAEVPFELERPVGCIISLRALRGELRDYSVDLSNYGGGASIGSYLCRRASERKQEYVGFYAFAPAYDFGRRSANTTGFRVDNDFRAWLGLMRRIKHMADLTFDFADLEEKTAELERSLQEKIEEMDAQYPDVGIRRYFEGLADNFEEDVFDPLSAVWEDEISRLLDEDDEATQ